MAVMWANGFVDRGHEVMVVSNLFDPVLYRLDGRILVRYLVTNNRNKIKKWCSSFSQARKHFKEFNPDVVIGVMEMCSMVSKVASWGLRIPVVMTEHYAFERLPYGNLTVVERISKFWVNKIYSQVTVLTEADKKVIGDRLKNVHVMSNPLAMSPLDMIPQKDRTVLAVGRLDAWKVKGFDVLIRAWGLINRQLTIDNGQRTMNNGQYVFQFSKQKGWRLQIAGTGSEESLQYLKQLCKESGVEDTVDFLGFRTDIEELYKHSEIFVLSSRYEGFGLVLIEAMSQGCACVACDYKGRQKEIFEELKNEKVEELKSGSYEVCKNGILCPPEDVNSLASALKKMMEDEDYRHQAQKNAIERSKYYSIENTMDRWETLLKEIVK